MRKYIKRILLAVVALMLFLGLKIWVIDNSEKIAIHQVALKCELTDVSLTLMELTSPIDPIDFMQLKKDYYSGWIYLNSIASVGMSENGLVHNTLMKEFVTHYENWYKSKNLYGEDLREAKQNVRIDRQTLEYEFTVTQGKSKLVAKRACKKIPRSIFEQERKRVANATKKMQKI
jgi:hypothetical protein